MALIHQAAAYNQTDLVQKCIDRGVRVNSVDEEHGRTPLHFAAEKGHVSMVRLLITFGARPELVDVYGLTPYELAEENGHVDVMQALRPGQAPPEADADLLLLECPRCRRMLRIPARFAGKKGRCTHCGDPIVAPVRGEELPAFPDRFTPSHEEALRILFDEALPVTRIESERSILLDYRHIGRAWRSVELVEGSLMGMRNIVAKNLKAMAYAVQCDEFQVVVDNERTWAAQVMGHSPDALRLLAIRVWRGADRLYACGGPDFIPHA